MSSRLNIVSTKFENVKSGSITYGVRVFDDYSNSYDNCWENIPENDFDVLRKLLKEGCSDNIADMLEFVKEHKQGVCIDEQWYDWDEIKHIFDESK